MRITARAVAYSACVFTLIALMFSPLHAQHQAASGSLAENVSATEVSTPSASFQQAAYSNVTIFYTSQLFGYFRAPDLQPAVWKDHEQEKEYGEGCKAAAEDPESPGNPDIPGSPAAKAFDKLWADQQNIPGKILVGTGDNFAPVLWARQFDAKHWPQDQYRGPNPQIPAFNRTGKELFDWDPRGKQWVTNETVADPKRGYSWLLESLVHGGGTIPTDNVGCFFRRAGYAAIVPGKYDFYFGPERLRELAQFLASDEQKVRRSDGEEVAFEPVQMLGANLVIETTWKMDHKPVGDLEDPPEFAPWTKPEYENPKQKAPFPTLISPKDKGNVYPWLPGAELKLMDLSETGKLLLLLQQTKPETKKNLETLLNSLKDSKPFSNGQDKEELDTMLSIVDDHVFPSEGVYLCGSAKPGNPNEIVSPGDTACLKPLGEPEVRVKGATVEYFYPFPQLSDFSTLIPGENYGLCVKGGALKSVSSNPEENFYCARFSVYTPFFQDLKPYALVKAEDQNRYPGLSQDVAIFGVVDPKLGQDVGMLNFAWSNSEEKKYKTETVAEDPGEALKELVGYFDREHKDFKGVRILLAQMAPEEAQKLAVRVGGFDAVVSGADSQLSGVDETGTAMWEGDAKDSKGRHAFLAVPQPYWVKDDNPRERLDLGKLTVEVSADGGPDRKFTAKHMQENPPDSILGDVKAPDIPRSPESVPFWKAVGDYVNARCQANPKPQNSKHDDNPPAGGGGKADMLSDTSSESDKEKGMESLTGCVMQEETGADVVLLQKRDFYLDWQQRFPTKTFELQQFLDRIIWKGDFLTLLYVPGSTLLNVMKQSKTFEDEDASLLSLSGETDRYLVYFGIRTDSANTDGYLINEVPLDPTRVYAVATSDFIAAGDTGYPDLAATAIHKFSTPQDFDKQLKNISGVVCQKLTKQAGGNPATACMDAIDRDSYFDEIVAAPTDTRQGDTTGAQLWKWSMFDQPKVVPEKKTASDEKGGPKKPSDLDAQIEQRPIRSLRINQPDQTLFAIDDAALNLNMTNHKFSDAALAQTFAGNPTTQLSAKRSHTIGYDIQPKFLYSWHTYQIFDNTEISYNEQDTGNINAPRTVNQKENMFSSDTGFARDIKDRTLPHVEFLATFHYETQIVHPTTTTLAPLPKGDTFAPSVNTERTHLFLPRIGARYVNRISWIEAGLEDGGELDAVRLIPPPPGGTQFGLFRTNMHVSGAYWKWHLMVPFGQKTTWTEDEDGDFFFNQRGDAATDTRFRSDTKTQVNFQIFPNLAFAPTYEFFYYANKVQQAWFWQNQASIQMKVRFDVWNRRRWKDQLEYKAPAASSK